MQADRADALALMAPSLTPSEAADLAPLTDAAWAAMKLWLINLLPTWGRLVYTTWLHAGQAGPGAGGLFVTKTVRELLYGEWGRCCVGRERRARGSDDGPWLKEGTWAAGYRGTCMPRPGTTARLGTSCAASLRLPGKRCVPHCPAPAQPPTGVHW